MKATHRIDGLTLPSVANLREHWRDRQKRTAWHRQSTLEIPWQIIDLARRSLPVTVHLVRVGPQPLDDDNLSSAFKAFRDGLAARLGLDDADPRVRFTYGQARGKPREYAVVVTIEGPTR